MIKEIIFDCFGVLTQDGWTAVLKKFATDENREQLSDLNKTVDKGLISFKEFVASVSEICGASEDELLTYLVKSYYPEDDVFEYIRQLKEQYRIGLISNISAPIEQYLPTAPVELFDEQTLSYQAGVIKPAKEIFEIHLAKTGTRPEEAVFIDDREANAEGATVAGLHGVWYKNLEQLKTELKELGVDT